MVLDLIPAYTAAPWPFGEIHIHFFRAAEHHSPPCIAHPIMIRVNEASNGRINPQALKWERIKRLCTQAYQQGVALSPADLAYLVGLSVGAVQTTIKERERVVLPTRGRVADMGFTFPTRRRSSRCTRTGTRKQR